VIAGKQNKKKGGGSEMDGRGKGPEEEKVTEKVVSESNQQKRPSWREKGSQKKKAAGEGDLDQVQRRILTQETIQRNCQKKGGKARVIGRQVLYPLVQKNDQAATGAQNKRWLDNWYRDWKESFNWYGKGFDDCKIPDKRRKKGGLGKREESIIGAEWEEKRVGLKAEF